MSCLFDSLAPAVCLHPAILRRAIVAYLKTNPKMPNDLHLADNICYGYGYNQQENINKNALVQKYASLMANPEVWGGEPEIVAFCELFNIDVVIHDLYSGKQFCIESSKHARKKVHIGFNGNHFTPKYVEI